MTSGFWNATIDVSFVSVWSVDLSVSALSLHSLPSRSDRMVANYQRTLYSLSCYCGCGVRNGPHCADDWISDDENDLPSESQVLDVEMGTL